MHYHGINVFKTLLCWISVLLCGIYTFKAGLVDAQGVANRDIKLENTLLDGSLRPLLKICDFGYSKVILESPRGK